MIKIDNLEISQTSQVIFDSFNSFILSEDRRVFNKLIARTLLYNQTQDIPGDIVECGVFKGTGLYTFLKLKNIFNPNSSKKVIGFDFFNTDTLISSIMDLDLEQPTYDTLNNLWDNVTKGGIIVFDEYGYHKWSESRGVDRFIEEKNLQIKSLNYHCPTAYIIK